MSSEVPNKSPDASPDEPCITLKIREYRQGSAAEFADSLVGNEGNDKQTTGYEDGFSNSTGGFPGNY